MGVRETELEDSSVAKMSGGRAVVESLRAEDARYVFGIVGSCMIEILDDMVDRHDIGWVGTRHEQSAAHMADGYARVSGTAGVCMATNGPGATSQTTGLSVALLSHSPLIAITGAPMISQLYRDSFREIDQVAMFRPLTKWSVQVPRAERIKVNGIAASGFKARASAVAQLARYARNRGRCGTAPRCAPSRAVRSGNRSYRVP